MSYKVLTMANHICDLPNPEDFPPGSQVQCVTEYLRAGEVGPCNMVWYRTESFLSKRAYWSNDWGW